MDVLKKILNKFTVLILLAVVVIYFAVSAPGFMTINNGMSLLRQIAVLGILSTGFAMVMIAGGLDLSISSQLSLVSCATALMIVNGVPCVAACIIGVLIAVAISAFNGMAIVLTGMPAMICTLAMQQVLQGVVYIFTGIYCRYCASAYYHYDCNFLDRCFHFEPYLPWPVFLCSWF